MKVHFAFMVTNFKKVVILKKSDTQLNQKAHITNSNNTAFNKKETTVIQQV